MYEKLWKHLNSKIKKSSCPAVFLLILTVEWGVAGILAGLILCMGMQQELAVKLTVIFCTGGYAGLIPGFLAGIFYLYKINLKGSKRSLKRAENAVKEADKNLYCIKNKTAV